MMKRQVSPIMTWAFWSIVVLGAFLTVTGEYFMAGFSTDASKITWIIVVFFVMGLWFSLRAALHLDKEFKSLQAMDADQRIGDPNSSDVAALFDAAKERFRRGDRIDARNLVSAYGLRLKAQIDNIGVIAGMLITIGLLGTVLGLIIAVTGMDAVFQSNSADFASMKAGMNETLSGLGTAFYTTLFGALLGGVVLKVLGAEMKKSASLLVADTLRFSELFIAPQFARNSSESMIELETQINGLQRQLGSLGDSFGAMVEILDSKQTALATGLAGLVDAVKQANTEAAEHTRNLVETVDKKVDETNRLADERLRTLVESVMQSGEEANTRINALVGSVNQTTEATNRMADERLRIIANTVEQANQSAEERILAVMERIGLVVDETHNKASERLEVLSDTVNRTTEETHRLADERLQSLLQAVEAAANQTHEKSEAHLVGFVEAVDRAIEQSRKDAERSLDNKASRLASKLNEAAMALSSMVNLPDVAIDVDVEAIEGE